MSDALDLSLHQCGKLSGLISDGSKALAQRAFKQSPRSWTSLENDQLPEQVALGQWLHLLQGWKCFFDVTSDSLYEIRDGQWLAVEAAGAEWLLLAEAI